MSQSGTLRMGGGSGGSGIQTINTIGPDGGGDFEITSPDSSITITPATNGLELVANATGFTPVTFCAAYYSNQNSVTGDGTVFPMKYDTVLFDSASGYNVGTGVYTVPFTGIYQISINDVYATASPSASWTGLISTLVINGSFVFRYADCNPSQMGLSSLGELTLSNSWAYPLTAGDTLLVQTGIYFGAKAVDIKGSANFCSRFSLFKVSN